MAFLCFSYYCFLLEIDPENKIVANISLDAHHFELERSPTENNWTLTTQYETANITITLS